MIQALQVRQAHGRRDFGHLAVGADINHLVIAGEAEILHKTNLPGEIIIISHDRPAFEGIHEFGGMETKDLAVTELPYHATLMRHTQGMGGIKKKLSLRR